jgi:hypothetical protein
MILHMGTRSMRRLQRFWFAVGLFCITTLLSLAFPAIADEPETPIAPAQPLQDGWQKIDERLVFLTIRLASVEDSLDAVEEALSKAGRRQSQQNTAVRRAELKNEKMDRNAGGPVRWDRFYGLNAEKFFYHPVESDTT